MTIPTHEEVNLSTYCLLLSDQFVDDMSHPDHQFFNRALRNASYARGTTHPNPAVGAVLVKDDRVIADGYTHAPGGVHAETHALASCMESAAGATLYVTLEPCSHFGRTPPCTHAIIDAGITRVVYGAIDPNPKVCGQGIAALRNAGILVEEISHPPLQKAAVALLAPFAMWIHKKRPYVVVKIATSADGRFAREHGVATKITGRESHELVHALRRASDGVLVSGNTIRIDNPLLTARLSPPGHGGQPVAIVVSTQGSIPRDAKIFHRNDGKTPLLITTVGHEDMPMDIITVPASKDGVDLVVALEKLAERGLTLILIEAGPRLCAQLVQQQLADEILWFRSRELFNSDGPHLENLASFMETACELSSTMTVGDDDLLIYTRD